MIEVEVKCISALYSAPKSVNSSSEFWFDTCIKTTAKNGSVQLVSLAPTEDVAAKHLKRVYL